MDFLRCSFDIQTLRLLSGSRVGTKPAHEGTSVFVFGKKIPLYNAYDAIEMALKDQVLLEISDQVFADRIGDLLMNEFVHAQEEAFDLSDLRRWFLTSSIEEVCTKEFALPLKLARRILLRMGSCFSQLCNMATLDEIQQ